MSRWIAWLWLARWLRESIEAALVLLQQNDCANEELWRSYGSSRSKAWCTVYSISRVGEAGRLFETNPANGGGCEAGAQSLSHAQQISKLSVRGTEDMDDRTGKGLWKRLLSSLMLVLLQSPTLQPHAHSHSHAARLLPERFSTPSGQRNASLTSPRPLPPPLNEHSLPPRNQQQQ